MADVFFRKLLKIRLNKCFGEPDILFLPSQQIEYTKKILKAIAQTNHDYFIWLRPHPLESQLQKEYEQLLVENDLPGEVNSKINLYDQLISSDIVVGGSSTVLLEALIAKKPILHCPYILQTPQENNFYNFKLGRCNNEKQLIKALNDPLQYYLNEIKDGTFNKKISKFVYKQAYKQDGKAGERCKALIKEMLGDEKK